jgi:hypothetical protein
MVDCKAIHDSSNFHFCTFYSKEDKLAKVVIRYLPGHISADVTVALQDIDYNIISLKQVTGKHPIQKDIDRLCGQVVRVLGYRFRSPGSIPGATRFSEKQWAWNGVHSAS